MKFEFRKHFTRLALTALAALLGSGVILGLVQANVQEWAKASGNDQYLVKYTGPLMDRIAAFTSSAPFVFVTAMIVGGAMFLWADTFVRRWSEWWAAQSGKPFSIRNIDRRLASMTTLFILMAAVVLCAAWVAYENRKPADQVTTVTATQTPRNLKTNLTLKFGQGSTLPIAEGLANIWRWYALSNVVIIVSPEGQKEIKTWNIFLALEKPIDVKQVTVSSKSPLPTYEVKDYSDRSAVIAFAGDLVNLSIEIDLLTAQAVPTQAPNAGPATISTTIPDKSPIKPRYNDSEIRSLIDVMGTLRRIVDQEIAPESWKSSDLNQTWRRKLNEIGPAALASEFKSYSDPTHTAVNKINKILYDNQLYNDQVHPVVEGFDSAVGGFIGASVDLANELNEYMRPRKTLM
jgi:hypothetical protein